MEIRPGVLRTPDDRFEGLPDFGFEPRYVDVPSVLGPLRMHYIDEGPRDASVVLMLHGNPMWSYLYRHMIGPITAAGYRAVVPDLIGFGRSDKPARRADYSYDRFVGWMISLFDQLDLRYVTLVCQDWGGPIGLRLLSERPERFAAVVATNTLLQNLEPAPGGAEGWPYPTTRACIERSRVNDDLVASELVASVAITDLSDDVLAAYDAPFPSAAYKAGMHQITLCIPADEGAEGLDANRRAWSLLDQWTKPFVTAFSDSDPSTRAWAEVFRHRIPGSKGQDHPVIPKAGHFVQEEQGEALATEVIKVMRVTAN